MIGGLHLEVLLAAGYAAFLALVAAVLKFLAQHTHRRSEQYHLAGFRYDHALDVWECPTGQHLHRQAAHPSAPFARYRAPAHACNSCHLKCRCTDSHEGREVVRFSLPWVETEMGRFHLGIGLALLSLALFILVIEFLRFRTLTERWVLAGAMVPLSLSWVRVVTKFRSARSRGGNWGSW
jgi:hypothetical protein